MACSAGVKLHHNLEKDFSILLDNSSIELQGSNLKIWATARSSSFNSPEYAKHRDKSVQLDALSAET